MCKIFLAALTVIISFTKVTAQNQLPDFSVEDVGNNKVLISWVNPFGESCIQLTVQSSFDSLKQFKTIFSTESPQLPQNGFVYTLPFKGRLYYRISYILNSNAFYFSHSKTPIPAGLTQGPEQLLERNAATRIITIRKYDSVVARIFYADYKSFKDSILKNAKDTLFIVSQDEIIIKPYNPTNYYKPSIYVVSNPEGYIEVKLPDAATKNYKLIFFDASGKKLFSLNHITDTDLVIDKVNFQHAGWFNFELYEDDRLKERSKILLQKDF
jgi:hypothetical protein